MSPDVYRQSPLYYARLRQLQCQETQNNYSLKQYRSIFLLCINVRHPGIVWGSSVIREPRRFHFILAHTILNEKLPLHAPKWLHQLQQSLPHSSQQEGEKRRELIPSLLLATSQKLHITYLSRLIT